ncbi:MAG: hypothetical protein IT210_20215 [Armatimonadetes bacterium]|nr:hypothetical protein [Armatimonadota bacterium]
MRCLWSARLALVLLLGCALAGSASPAGRSLEEFGDISTPESAAAALKAGVAALAAGGGGILEIPAHAPEGLAVENTVQQKPDEPTVTIIDHRKGYLKTYLPSIGKHQTGVWAGSRLERKLNLGQVSLPHCGVYSNQAIQNYIVSGASSYMLTLTDPVRPGKDVRCYVDTIRGIWVGQYLNITGGPMNYSEPYDRITVKSIGWDRERRRNYFTADLEYEHPVGAIVYNKHVVNGLQVEGYSNCDNQTMELQVSRRHYGVGDSFVISGTMKYMSDVFSGFGDEGGIVLNAETIGEIDGFHAAVEAVNPGRDEITYTPGVTNPHTLSNSRPLINMNRKKWLAGGTVRIVAPGGTYRGKSYPSIIGGIANVFNYQGGLILGSKDCGWTPEVVGRFFALTDPSEIIEANDPSSVGGYAQLAGRPVYRWYQINGFEANPDGTKIIKILRVRWSAVPAGAPKLFDDDNYTFDGHERPLHYAIVPGAWVYDISQGWADTISTGGYIGQEASRKIRVAPGGDRGAPFDFEPGDPIEQAVGPDPWQPTPLRIRQFDQMPSTMDNATIQAEQLARVQVPKGIALNGIVTGRDQLKTRKDRKPPWDTMIDLASLSRIGLNFGAENTEAAIRFAQPNGYPQLIRWQTAKGESSSLTVPPKTGDFVLTGGHLDLSGKSARQVSGLSATTTSARNLRGIDVAVRAGAKTMQVRFPRAEADKAYAVFLTPSWPTAFGVTRKTARGFDAQFTEAAPKGARMDWMIVR